MLVAAHPCVWLPPWAQVMHLSRTISVALSSLRGELGAGLYSSVMIEFRVSDHTGPDGCFISFTGKKRRRVAAI